MSRLLRWWKKWQLWQMWRWWHVASSKASVVYWTIGPMRELQPRATPPAVPPNVRVPQQKGQVSMSLVMTVTQEVDAAAKFQDGQGNPAEVQNPTWSSTDVGIAFLEVNPDDPLKVVIKAGGTVGNAQVNIVGDADLGDGVREVSAVLDVEIKAAEAVSVIVDVGTPREQGEPPARGRAGKKG